MSNNRIYYPVHMVAIKDNDGNLNFAAGDEVHGVQSMSTNTAFNVDRTNQLGMLSIYANVEGIPDVDMSLNKVLDGYPTPYLMSTQTALAPDLAARSAVQCTVGAAIYPDTNTHSSGVPETSVAFSGAYVDSVSYNFTTDGNFSEDTSFVGNDKLWYKTSIAGTPDYGEADLKSNLPSITWSAAIGKNDSPLSSLGVATAAQFQFDVTGSTSVDTNGAINDADTTVMPTEIAGFTTSGTNPLVSGEYQAHVSSFTASVSFARSEQLELGRRGPYFKPAELPVEVTSELQATASEGDLVSALTEGIFDGVGAGACSAAGSNTKDRTIRVVLCEGLRLYLGTKNRLQSTGYSGGDADGGNVTISYTYTNFNDFVVMHPNDPNVNFTWADRTTLLVE